VERSRRVGADRRGTAEWIGGRGDPGLVERNRNDFVPPESVHAADIDGQIISRLPLNVEGRVHGVGQLVIAGVSRQEKGNIAVLDSASIRERRRQEVAVDYSWLGDCTRIAVWRRRECRAPGVRK